MNSRAAAHRNSILAALPDPVLERLSQHLEPVSLPVRRVLYRPNGPIDWVYFPLSGIASSVGGAPDNRIEVGITGRDGMTGLSLVLGMNTAPHECYMQITGDGLRIAAVDSHSGV